MMTTVAGRVLKVLVFSLAVAAISRGEAVMAAALPVVTGQGAIEQALRTPTGLALGAGGSLYVSDPANQGVLKFSVAGKLTQKLAVKGIPQGVAVTPDGRLLVSLKESVAIFDATGTEVGKLGAGVGQFQRAAGITVDDTGLIYVADSKGGCVQLFTSGGAYLSRFGSKGSGDGQFRYPTSIAYEKISRQIAVVDSLNARVQFYDLNGAFIRSVGGGGTGPLKFMHPQGVTFEYGAAGMVRMYVADTMLKKIQAIDPAGSGQFLSYISDIRDGQAIPSELVFDQARHRLYTVNGLGGISYYIIADGNVVVNGASVAVPTTATVLASTARPNEGSVAVSPAPAVPPFVLSTVADGSTVAGDFLDITGLAPGVSRVAVNGQEVAVVNGLFSTAVPLVAGANEIFISVTDGTGKTWKELRTVKHDAGAPDVFITTADVLVTSKALLTIKGSMAHGVQVSVAGVPADVDNLEWSSNVTLTPGLNTIEIQAMDLTGRLSSQKRTVFYKPAAPELAVTFPVEDLGTARKEFVIQGVTVAAGDVVVTATVNGVPRQVTVDGGRISLSMEFPKEGVYTAILQATGAGGEVSTVSRTVVYRVLP